MLLLFALAVVAFGLLFVPRDAQKLYWLVAVPLGTLAILGVI